MKITKHAYKRFKQRTDFTATEMNRNANQAWKNGLKIACFSEPFYSYLTDLQFEGDRTSIKVYDKYVYVFDNRHHNLITIYPVPNEFLPISNHLGQNKNEPCMIEATYNGKKSYVCESIDEPIIFKSKQSAINFIKNSYELTFDAERVVVISVSGAIISEPKRGTPKQKN